MLLKTCVAYIQNECHILLIQIQVGDIIGLADFRWQVRFSKNEKVARSVYLSNDLLDF